MTTHGQVYGCPHLLVCDATWRMNDNTWTGVWMSTPEAAIPLSTHMELIKSDVN